MNKFLTLEKIEELKLSHKKELDKHICDYYSKQIIYEEGDKINSQLMIKFFDKLISIYGRELKLNILLDNAKYQKSFLIE